MIDAARGGDAAAQEELHDRYRGVVVAFLRRRGLEADAEDVAQEVFVRLFQRGVLARADPGRGSFRALLLAVTRHTLSDHLDARAARKRGGGAAPVPLDDVEPPAPDEQTEFDREWLLAVLEAALARLRREHPNYHAAVKAHLLEGQPQAQVAAAAGLRPGDVRNHLHRGRRKLMDYVREEAWRTSAGPDDHATELEYLARLCASARRPPG